MFISVILAVGASLPPLKATGPVSGWACLVIHPGAFVARSFIFKLRGRTHKQARARTFAGLPG